MSAPAARSVGGVFEGEGAIELLIERLDRLADLDVARCWAYPMEGRDPATIDTRGPTTTRSTGFAGNDLVISASSRPSPARSQTSATGRRARMA